MVDDKIFDKYLGKPGELKLVDEDGNIDVFHLEQLSFEYMADIIAVQDALSKAGKDPTNITQYINPEIAQKMNRLVMDTLKMSFPDANEQKLDGFGKNNFMSILTAIFQINSYGFDKMGKVQETLERLRKGVKSETQKVEAPGGSVKSNTK